MRLWSLVDARKLPMASAASRPNVVTACKGRQGGCRGCQGGLAWPPSLAHPRRRRAFAHGCCHVRCHVPICPTCNHTHTNNIRTHTPTHAPARANSHPHTHTCTREPTTCHMRAPQPSTFNQASHARRPGLAGLAPLMPRLAHMHAPSPASLTCTQTAPFHITNSLTCTTVNKK